MKIVSINSVVNGSTGGVMLGVANAVRAAGGQAYTFSEKRRGQAAPAGHRFFGSRAENLLHRTTAAFTGISGTGSKLGTAALLRQIQKIQPDIIHLHNLHGWYVNLPMLFSFLKKATLRLFGRCTIAGPLPRNARTLPWSSAKNGKPAATTARVTAFTPTLL